MPIPLPVKLIACIIVSLFSVGQVAAQHVNHVFTITILDDKLQPAENVVVMQLQADTNVLVKTALTDKKGEAHFRIDKPGKYRFEAQLLGYNEEFTVAYALPSNVMNVTMNLTVASIDLQEVSVTSKRSFLEIRPGKTVINVGSHISSAGTTVNELLPRLPGVSVDKNGVFSLQGKSKVLVLIDGRPTYLSGDALLSRLSGISSAMVDQIELLSNPSAKYDASGNAGIINIKTKKNLQEGFNGNVSVSASKGRYYKTTDFINLNYKKGKFNTFFNYTADINNGFTDVYAFRNYHEFGDLDILTNMKVKRTNTALRAGTDYQLSDKSRIGLTLSGTTYDKHSPMTSTSSWLGKDGIIDSTISMKNLYTAGTKNAAVNLNFSSQLSESQQFSVDLDVIDYDADNDQRTTDQQLSPDGFLTGSIASLPSTIMIYAGKTDYAVQIDKNKRFEGGVKLSKSSTDNISDFIDYEGNSQSPDLANSYRYKYKENIVALYSSLNITGPKLSTQLGLRYEKTHYSSQLKGNSVRRDTGFISNYGSLFPSSSITYKADSLNSFTFTAGRRIDRPSFSSLNPFLIIVNSYTLQSGNEDLKPQFSWNFELGHSWNDKIITTLYYNVIKNYLTGSSLPSEGGTVIVKEVNVNDVQNIGASVATQLQPLPWWSLTASGSYTHQKFSGYKNWDIRRSNN
ncbi:MAG: TonB-dependent receptor, partial [Sphingobacteriaceae bacterium]